jgi:hypothetical protein
MLSGMSRSRIAIALTAATLAALAAGASLAGCSGGGSSVATQADAAAPDNMGAPSGAEPGAPSDAGPDAPCYADTLACGSVLIVDFTTDLTAPGTLTVEALTEFDDVRLNGTTTCTVTPPKVLFVSCPPSGAVFIASLALTGSSTLRLLTGSTTYLVRKLTVRVSRDGSSLGEKVYTPSYATAPPACDVPSCPTASVSFP